MNYTKNYHLPQWVETDRILMQDFNQMCKDMEDGLVRNAAGAAVANAQTAADAAAANAKTAADAAAAAEAAESKAFDQACRLAYNHFCFAQTVTPFPRQLGVFYLDTASSGAGLSGLVKYQDYYQMNNAPKKTAAELLAMFQQTEMNADTGKTPQPLSAAFTAPCNGIITSLRMHVTFEGLTGGIPQHYADMACRDLTTGRTIKEVPYTMVLEDTGGYRNLTIQEQLPIECGHSYQITVTPRKASLGTLRARFDSLYFTSGATGGTASAIHSFQNPEENLGFVAVASYQFTKNCAEPKMLAGGKEVPAWWSRTVEDGKGNTIRETVFRRSGAVKDGEQLQLELFCGAGETLTLYNWGVTLI